MHSNVTHARAMQREALEPLEIEGGPAWFGDCGSGLGSQSGSIPKLQVAALENSVERSQTCPDYKARHTHKQNRAHVRGRGERKLLH